MRDIQLADRLTNLFGHHECTAYRGFGQDDHELFATIARYQIRGTFGIQADCSGYLAQAVVTGLVAVGVIEELEKIKLEKPEYAELIDKIKTAIEGGQDASVMLEELNTKVNTPPPPAPVITDPAVDPAIEKANALIADMEKRQEALVEKAGVAEIREQVTASVLPAVVKSSLIERLTASKTFDAEKIKALPNETKNKLINYLVSKREPIVKDFINSDTDVSWLSCMGYMYPAKGKVFEFLCTCENKIKIEHK